MPRYGSLVLFYTNNIMHTSVCTGVSTLECNVTGKEDFACNITEETLRTQSEDEIFSYIDRVIRRTVMYTITKETPKESFRTYILLHRLRH